MKIRIYLVIFLLLSFYLFSNDIKTYDRELVKYFNSDDKEIKSLKFQKSKNGFAGCSPTCFTIANNNKIFVCDSCRRRYVDLGITDDEKREGTANNKYRILGY